MRFPEFIEKLPEADFPANFSPANARGWIIQAPNHQVVFLATEGDIEAAEHSHEAQWEIPLQGGVELTVSGQTKFYGPGQPFYVPAGVPHGGKVRGPYLAILVFDGPNRYRVKNKEDSHG